MKKFFIILTLMFFVAITISAQNIKLSDVTISSGKTATSSGLDTRATFTNSKSLIFYIQSNSDRSYIQIGKKFGNFQLSESIGVYKNIPWTGPMIVYQKSFFDAMIWSGIAFANDKKMSQPDLKPQFFMNYDAVGFTFLKTNRIGGAVMWFQDQEINWFVSYKKIVALGEKSKLFSEITYNHTLDIPMFVIGYNLKF